MEFNEMKQQGKLGKKFRKREKFVRSAIKIKFKKC